MNYIALIFTVLFCLLKQSYAKGWVQQGMTFTNGKYCPEVPYGSPESLYSLEQLKSTGANFVAIIVSEYQTTYNSTEVFPIYTPIKSSYYTYITETTEDLTKIIKYAHQIGLQVMLKLQIDLIDDDDHWRGDIGYGFNQTQWDQWFDSYGKALIKYAKLAQQLQVEQFSVGCELIATNDQETNWRILIKEVREYFKGIVIDSSNWGFLDWRGGEDTHKKWWDAVDIIGIDAYYDVCKEYERPTIEQLIECWQPVVHRFQNLSDTFQRPVIMSEVGTCSGECDRNEKPDLFKLMGQADRYDAIFQAFSNLDFFWGFFWWTWNTDPASGGSQDICITPQNKPAELVVRQYYGGWEFLPEWEGEAQCPCTV